MRFQFSTTATFPPTPTFGAVSPIIGIPTWKTANESSGQTSVLVPGPATIIASGLLLSWGGITTAGYLQITYDPEVAPIKIFQTLGNGHIYLPLNNTMALGPTGLQVANNSDGGEYSVIIFYEEL